MYISSHVGFHLCLEGTGVHLVLKIMVKVEEYYLVENIVLIPEIVLQGPNPCVAVHATL